MNELKLNECAKTVDSIIDFVNDAEKLVILLEVALVSEDNSVSELLARKQATIVAIRDALAKRKEEIANIVNLLGRILPDILFDVSKHYSKVMYKMCLIKKEQVIVGFPPMLPTLDGDDVMKYIQELSSLLLGMHDKHIVLELLVMAKNVCSTVKNRIPVIVSLISALNNFKSIIPEVVDIAKGTTPKH